MDVLPFPIPLFRLTIDLNRVVGIGDIVADDRSVSYLLYIDRLDNGSRMVVYRRPEESNDGWADWVNAVREGWQALFLAWRAR